MVRVVLAGCLSYVCGEPRIGVIVRICLLTDIRPTYELCQSQIFTLVGILYLGHAKL